VNRSALDSLRFRLLVFAILAGEVFRLIFPRHNARR